jgi:hypothetical protein
VSISTAAPGVGIAIGVGDGCGHQHAKITKIRQMMVKRLAMVLMRLSSLLDERTSHWPAEPVLRGPFMLAFKQVNRQPRGPIALATQGQCRFIPSNKNSRWKARPLAVVGPAGAVFTNWSRYKW